MKQHTFMHTLHLWLLLFVALVPALARAGVLTTGNTSGSGTVVDPGGGTYWRTWRYTGNDFDLNFKDSPTSGEYFSCSHPTFTWSEPYFEFTVKVNGMQGGKYPQAGYNFQIQMLDANLDTNDLATINNVGPGDGSTTLRRQLHTYLSGSFNFLPEMVTTQYGIVRAVRQEGVVSMKQYAYPFGEARLVLRYYPSAEALKKGCRKIQVIGNFWYEGKVHDAILHVTYTKDVAFDVKPMAEPLTATRVAPRKVQLTAPKAQSTVKSTNSETQGVQYRSISYEVERYGTVGTSTAEQTKATYTLGSARQAIDMRYQATVSENFTYDYMVKRRISADGEDMDETLDTRQMSNSYVEPYDTNVLTGAEPCDEYWTLHLAPLPKARTLQAVYKKWGQTRVSLAWEKDAADADVDTNGQWYIYRTLTDAQGNALAGQRRELVGKVPYATTTYDDKTVATDVFYRYEVMFGCSSWEAQYWTAEEGYDDELGTAAPVTSTTSEMQMSFLRQIDTPEGKNGITLQWETEKIEDSSLQYIVHRKVGTDGKWDDHYATVSVAQNNVVYTDENALSASTPYYYFIEVDAMGKNFHSETATAFYAGTSTLQSFTSSTGFYADKVALAYQVKRGTTDAYRIRVARRIMGIATAQFRTIATIEGSEAQGSYDDKEVKPGDIYEYSLTLLEKDASGQYQEHGEQRAIGFCRSTGIVSGRVTYGTGAAVAGARVTLSGDGNDVPSSNSQYALRVNTASSGLTWTPSSSAYTSLFGADKAFALQLWVNPDSGLGANTAGAEKGKPRVMDVQGAFQLRMVPEFEHYYLQVTQNDQPVADLRGVVLLPNSYTHLTASYEGHTLTVTARRDSSDMAMKATAQLQPWTLDAQLSYALNFVGAPGLDDKVAYKGYIDDVRVWGKALAEQDIATNYDRLLGGTESQLMAYWPLDENLGAYVFDYSSSQGVANCNTPDVDLSLKSDAYTPRSLTIYGVTDTQGNYIIRGIPFASEGTNYVIRPSLGAHEFSPAHRTGFISSNTLTASGTDFSDVSSFPVTGTVVYEGTNYPVEGALLKIDGVAASRDGQAVTTDAQGCFTISVPIGDHYVSVELSQHTFANRGRYPAEGTMRFDRAMSGLTFQDATTVVLAGRVAGGAVEGAKPVGFGESKNNVGQAIVSLKASDLYYLNAQWNGTRYAPADEQAPVEASTEKTASTAWRGKGEQDAHRIFIKTDPLTGEFSAKVPPLTYTVESVSVPSNAAVAFSDLPKQINLTKVGEEYKDTLKTMNAQGDSIVSYFTYAHKLMQTFYDPAPVFRVSQVDENGSAEAGAFGMKSYVPVNDTDLLTNLWTIDAQTHDLQYAYGYPLFKQGQNYDFLIEAYDVYTNNDGDKPVVDKVPQKNVVVTVSNPMSSSQDIVAKSDDSDIPIGMVYKLKNDQMMLNAQGRGTYSWQAGAPNLTKPFTRTINITGTLNKKPQSAQPIEGIVLGCVPTGNNYVTEGPDRLLNILRDPPASASKITLSNDTVVTTDEVRSAYFQNDEMSKFASYFGGEIKSASGGTGFMILSSSKAVVTINHDFSASERVGDTNKKTQTISFKRSISTSGSDAYVGTVGDVYVGYSSNVIIGDGRYVDFVKDPVTKQYELKLTDGQVLDTKMSTMFQYTQTEIENKMIPTWQKLRNDLLARQPKAASEEAAKATPNNTRLPMYVTWLDPSDKNYGQGGTYAMVPPAGMKVGDVFTDSVAYMNRQVDTWKHYLELNEQDKVEAFNQRDKYFKENLSFDSGVALTRTFSVKNDTTRTDLFSYDIKNMVSGQSGYLFNGFGITEQAGYGPSGGKSNTDTQTRSYTHSYTYSIMDTHDKVDLTFDVYDSPHGWGPIFRVRGGQTRCPYQAEEHTKYYRPDDQSDSYILNYATTQMEKPRIVCDERVKHDVPAGTAAVFKLKLMNESDADISQSYALKYADGTNTQGARILVDGLPLPRNFSVGAGQILEKTLTIEQTDLSVTQFENIKLSFASTCQSGGNFPAISDAVQLSVYYAPTSSAVALSVPHTTVNSVTGAQQALTISGFDRSFKNFYGLRLQVMPEGSTQWTTLREYVLNKKDSVSASQMVIPATGAITYPLDMSNYAVWPDGTYRMRVISVTRDGTQEVTRSSDEFTLVKDLECPQPLGLPLPKDGFLKAGDDIAVNFNEDIIKGQLTANNVVATAILNDQAVEHGTALRTKQAGAATLSEYSLGQSGYTFELWLNHHGPGEIVGHGNSGNRLALSIDDNYHLVAQVGDKKVTSAYEVPADKWVFLACSFNGAEAPYALNAVMAYDDVQTTLFDNKPMGAYRAKGRLTVGDGLDAQVSQMALWNCVREPEESFEQMHQNKTASEPGLMGFWSMDEGHGTVAADATGRNPIALAGESWWTDNGNKAAVLDGQHTLTVPLSHVSTLQKDSYAVEMWFRADKQNSQPASLFRVGSADKPQVEAAFDEDGRLHIVHDGADDALTTGNLYDGLWHHFALNVQRGISAIAYIDGAIAGTVPEKTVPALAGDSLRLGANLSGAVDELRLWNASLTGKYLADHRYERADTAAVKGLVAYYPFDRLRQNAYHLWEASFSPLDMCGQHQASAVAEEGNDTPVLQRAKHLTVLNTSFTASERSIYITVNNALRDYEGATVNFEVSGVYDLNGNVSRPIIWSALAKLNTLKWASDSVMVYKNATDAKTFTAVIKNTGSKTENFMVTDLPQWLAVDQTSGLLEPLSQLTLTFTVKASAPIGTLQHAISLTGNNDVHEPLLVTVKVSGERPDWSIDPHQFESSMNLVGQVYVNDRMLTDDESLLAAFIDGECVGVVSPKYMQSRDAYFVSMTIYGHSYNYKADVQFRLWDATTGTIYSKMQCDPVVIFTPEAMIGSYNAPALFRNVAEREQHVSLYPGWNWMSLNVMPVNASVDAVMSGLQANVTLVKRPDTYAQWGGDGYKGSLQSMKAGEMYNVRASLAGTVVAYGSTPDAEQSLISLGERWNWIGSTATSALSLDAAFTDAIPTDGDMVKSQTAFAIYTDGKWEGSLDAIVPGVGYKYCNEGEAKTFRFPAVAPTARAAAPRKAVARQAWSWFKPVPVGQYADNMTLVAQIRDGAAVADTMELAAFVGDECRTVARAIDDNWYLTIPGEGLGDVLTFKTYRDGEVLTFPETDYFRCDAVRGEPSKPVVFDLAQATRIEGATADGVTLWPHMATTAVHISAPATIVKVYVYGIAGNAVATHEPKAAQADIDVTQLAQGQYLVRVVMADGHVANARFTKRQ